MRRRTRTDDPAAYYQPQVITMAEVERYRTAAREYWLRSRSRLMTVWMLGALLVALLAAAVTMVVTGRVKLDSVVRNEPKVDVFELKNIGETELAAFCKPECWWCGNKCPEMKPCGLCPPKEMP